FGVERGLDARTSVGAAYSNAVFRGIRRQYIEGSVRRALGPALAELSAASNLAGGFGLRGQIVAQLGETSISAEAVNFGRGYQSERFDIDIRRQIALSVDHSFRIFRQNIPFHIEAQQKIRLNGDHSWELGARSSINIHSINATTEFKWEQEKRAFGTDPPARLDSVTRLSGRIGRLRLRGDASFRLAGLERGFRDAQVTADFRGDERSEYRLEVGYNAAGSRARASAGYTRRFQKFAATAQLEAATDGSVAAGLNLAFSIGPDPRGGFRVVSDKLAVAGQALAIVYQDENGDGIRQPDEPVQKNVELTAGLTGKGEPTDENGASMIDGLQPFQPVLIGIDAGSLPDPFIQPANSGIVVTPRPGVPFRLELPLVAAGEIAGTLQSENGSALGGVEIELIDAKSQTVKATRSEYDGFFLFEGVPYGQYQLRLAALSANIIGVEQRLAATATLNRDKPTLELGVVIAQKAARIAGADIVP
ncbi:MAG: carboxypeptidase regulatory-like domain-containing protein, partial [Sphingorhabdus sp.]|nr:carboxypeptidase regulatory-like domain-containing protein [Sphingorhabdus sp.]